MTDFVSLPSSEWTVRQQRHIDRVENLTASHQQRRRRGERHPVWDFMFSYYPVTPGKLKKWHPGIGFGLMASENEAEEHPLPTFKDHYNWCDGAWVLDADKHWAHRGTSIAYIRRLLAATASRPMQLNCFGLHEWAMVYRDQPRHPEPLRLGASGTNEVVETHQLRCTHYDAFRFFTDAAAPRNAHELTRDKQVRMDQPGCVHASMDLYKWATKLGPLLPGELWVDTFELACQLRELDMRASPYDLSDWGFSPIPIEAPSGRAEYVRQQKALAEKGQVLRLKILRIIDDHFTHLIHSSLSTDLS